jgi:hypothetical protein
MPELSEELMRDYANALTFLGVCQYFPDDALLRGYVFLRPKWIIDALFTLLLHDSLDETRGHFTENDTLRIWTGPEYRGMHGLLVRMMERFELCYRVEGDGQTYILPQRLPGENQTYGWNEPDDTPVQYRYKFMPKGILTRLICRLHTRIETDPERGQRVWNDAVIFALPARNARKCSTKSSGKWMTSTAMPNTRTYRLRSWCRVHATSALSRKSRVSMISIRCKNASKKAKPLRSAKRAARMCR